MFVLYNSSTNTVVQEWSTIPSEVHVPHLSVFGVSSGWSHGNYHLLPVTYKEEPRHHLSVANGSYHEVSKDKSSITITYKYIDPPFEATREKLLTKTEEEAKKAIASLDIDHVLILEALEIKSDPEPDINNYPLHAPTVGMPGIETITDAAVATLTKFKEYRHSIANIITDKNRTKLAIKAAKSIKDLA